MHQGWSASFWHGRYDERVWAGIAVGGALGALARWGLGSWVTALMARTSWGSFPLGTLLINVLGSFALSLVVTAFARGTLSVEWRQWIGTGFLGAFTTFSTFSVEAQVLLARGEWARAWLYLLGNVALGLAAVLAGRYVGERW